MQLVHHPRSVKMFNKCIKGRNRYKAKFHHKIKLEYNHKTVAIKDIDTIYTCYRLKGGWTATPASSGTYPTTAVAPPNGWGQPRDRGKTGGHGESRWPSPGKRRSTPDQGMTLRKGFLEGLKMLLFGCTCLLFWKDLWPHFWADWSTEWPDRAVKTVLRFNLAPRAWLLSRGP